MPFSIKQLDATDLSFSFQRLKSQLWRTWHELMSRVVGTALGTDASVSTLYFTTCPLSWKVDINLEGKIIENAKYSFKF